MRKIVTNLDPKPIPMRNFDWLAVDDNYEPGDLIGHGTSELEAIKDLLEQIEELG
jgi:hypothetical protein